MAKATAQAQKLRTIRLVAVPSEHGGWGFVLEPGLLGLLLAPSVAGAWLAVAMLGAFLARQPLKLALADRRGGKRYPRTVLAERFAAAFGLAGAGALLVAALTARSQAFWWAVVAAAPLALLQGYYDSLRQSRQVAAELAGATAMGAGVTAIVLASGRWEMATAFALWAVVAARAVPSIVYVRARLRLERGEWIDRVPSLAAHGVGLALVAGLVAVRVLPWLALVAMAVLCARAVWACRRGAGPRVRRLSACRKSASALRQCC
jgi:YwiC-like protein